MARVVALGVLVSALLLTVLAAGAYYRVGWSRMEAACAIDDAQGSVHEGVAYSWRPFVFECTYDDGTTETSPWF